MQHVFLTGRLGGDPEQGTSNDGKQYFSLNLAVNIKEKGEEQTVWYTVYFREEHAKMLAYLSKGKMVTLRGILRKPEIYTNPAGKQSVKLRVSGEGITFVSNGKKQEEETVEKRNDVSFSNIEF